eukprot:1199446-Lingulodinium_polyedra.AAC.1
MAQAPAHDRGNCILESCRSLGVAPEVFGPIAQPARSDAGGPPWLAYDVLAEHAPGYLRPAVDIVP